MDLAAVLHQASVAVERAGVAADLRGVAFTTAVQLVVTGSREAVAPLPPAAPALVPVAAPPAAPPAVPAAQARTAPAAFAPPAPVVPPGGDALRPAIPQAPQQPSQHASHPAPPVPGPPAHLRPADAAAPAPPAPGAAHQVATGGAGDPWELIAGQLGVRPELLDRLWEERGGRLQLTGDVARLGRTRAARVSTAALLLLAALRWSGRDGGEPVPDAVVRAEVERLGLLDTGNYTKHLASRRHHLSTTGSGRSATYRLRYDGTEEAKRVARGLLDEA